MPEDLQTKLTDYKKKQEENEAELDRILREKEHLKTTIGVWEGYLKDRERFRATYEKGYPEVHGQQMAIEKFIEQKEIITSNIINADEKKQIEAKIKGISDEWEEKKEDLEDAKKTKDDAQEALDTAQKDLREKKESYDQITKRITSFNDRIKAYTALMAQIKEKEQAVEIAQMYFLLNCLHTDYQDNFKDKVKEPKDFGTDLDAGWNALDEAKDEVKKAEDDLAEKRKPYDVLEKKMATRAIAERNEILEALKGMKVTDGG